MNIISFDLLHFMVPSNTWLMVACLYLHVLRIIQISYVTVYHSGRVQSLSLFKDTEGKKKQDLIKEPWEGRWGRGDPEVTSGFSTPRSENKAVILPGFSNLSAHGNHLGFLLKIDSAAG